MYPYFWKHPYINVWEVCCQKNHPSNWAPVLWNRRKRSIWSNYNDQPAEVTPNDGPGWARESLQNPLNSGFGIILICPDPLKIPGVILGLLWFGSIVLSGNHSYLDSFWWQTEMLGYVGVRTACCSFPSSGNPESQPDCCNGTSARFPGMHMDVQRIHVWAIQIRQKCREIYQVTKSHGFYGMDPYATILIGPHMSSPVKPRPVVPAPQASPATVRCSGFRVFVVLIWWLFPRDLFLLKV